MRRASVLPAVVLVAAAIALLAVCAVAYVRRHRGDVAVPTGAESQPEPTVAAVDAPPQPGPSDAPPKPEWTDAPGGTARIGDVAVTVTSVVKFGQERKYLGVRLRVVNRSETRTIAYGNWNRVSLRLSDDLGNRYERRLKVSANETLRPGDATQTALDFQAPFDKASTLFLELPASHVGEQGAFKFRIPVAAIEVEAPPPPEPPPVPGRGVIRPPPPPPPPPPRIRPKGPGGRGR
jgi:hypothetical protein